MTERNRTIALVGAIATVLLVVAGVAFATVAGRAFDSYGPTLLAFTVPVITTLLASAGIQNELGAVHQKVNGNYSTLVAQNAALADQLVAVVSQLTPTQAANVEPLDLAAHTAPIPMITPGNERPRHAR